MTNKSVKPQDFIPIDSTRWDSSWPELEDEAEIGRLFNYMEDRFGIARALFDNYLFFKKKNGWWMIRKSRQLKNATHLKVIKTGMKAFGRIGKFVKPTTKFIQIFGSSATTATVEIDEKELGRLVNGEEIPSGLNLDTGYVILVLNNKIPLGLGFLINGKIRSQIPKKEIRKAMLNLMTL